MVIIKMKPLLPVLREKKRYLAFEIISEQEIPNNIASKAIKESFINLFGLNGYANAGYLFLNDMYDPEKKTGIIRVSTKEIDNFKTSLVFLNKINGKDALIKTKSCSGIIKKAKNKR